MKALTKAAVQGAACGFVIGAVLLVGQHVWHPVTAAAEAPGVAEVVKAQHFEISGWGYQRGVNAVAPVLRSLGGCWKLRNSGRKAE